MNFNCQDMIITPNEDSTYRMDLLGCKFKSNNGEEIEGIVTFPRVSKNGVNTFKNENMLPETEIYSVFILG